ncbi:alpha/beta fold hydrolase [Streptomyces sp. NPDC056500]|uniref:alpha/beta fold hydrolase n=1 Tax=Streptomyces sp. NPDC056500 TaxID=3345840 RepID=UPI0036927444
MSPAYAGRNPHVQRRRLVPLLAVSVMATLAPGLAATPAAAQPLAQYTQQKLKWKRCVPDLPATLQCAKIKVPLDHQKPTGKKTEVAISRMKTSTAAKRRGVLFFNPGGPGGSGLYMPYDMMQMLPKSVRDRYDLIGFDPRGVNHSSPVSCGLTDKDLEWPRPYKAATYNKDVSWARGVADKCRKKVGDKLPHFTTRNTARDMDVIRAALGEKKISYLGYSYGTYLGAVYSQMFPSRADRFVLDSAVDPKLAWRGMIQVWAEGTEPAFKRWTEWAAKRHTTYRLGDTPAKVSKTYWDLVARADKKPIKIDGEVLGGDAIRAGRQVFFFVDMASRMVSDLKKAAAGKATSGKRSIAPTQAPRSFATSGNLVPSRNPAASGNPALSGNLAASGDFATLDNLDSAFWTVVCNDNSAAWPRDTEQYRKDAIRDKARYPLFGDFASNIKPCAFWNKSVEPVTVVDNKVPALILQNEWDPQTPLSSALGLHRALKGSKLLTVKGGEGHGVYGGLNFCADSMTNTYLNTGKLPTKNVSCQASGAPRTSGPRTSPIPLPQLPNRF